MQHADDIPPRRHLFWRIVVPCVVLVLVGIGAGIVWQMFQEDRVRDASGEPVTKP